MISVFKMLSFCRLLDLGFWIWAFGSPFLDLGFGSWFSDQFSGSVFRIGFALIRIVFRMGVWIGFHDLVRSSAPCTGRVSNLVGPKRSTALIDRVGLAGGLAVRWLGWVSCRLFPI